MIIQNSTEIYIRILIWNTMVRMGAGALVHYTCVTEFGISFSCSHTTFHARAFTHFSVQNLTKHISEYIKNVYRNDNRKPF